MRKSEIPFRIDPSIVERVWKLLDDGSRRVDGYDPGEAVGRPRIPTEAEIEQLLSIAYLASIKREEDRPVKFSLEFTPPLGPERVTCAFDVPVSFTTKALVKIAPAFQLPFRTFGVWPKPGGSGELEMWGVTKFSEPRLRLRVLGPGRLAIHLDGGAKAILTDSRFGVVAETSPGFWNRPGRELPRYIDGPNVDLLRFVSDLKRSHALLSMAKELSNHGHGGALLFTPLTSWETSVKHPLQYRLRPPYTEARDCIADDISAGVDYDSLSPETTLRLERWRAAIANIGAFTSIDGAVILEHDFSVPAIGVKIQPVSSFPSDALVDETDVFVDSVRESRLLPDLGGTRHASAVQFAFDQRDAVAIVASQDGVVSAVEWDPEAGRVVVTRHIEVLFP